MALVTFHPITADIMQVRFNGMSAGTITKIESDWFKVEFECNDLDWNKRQCHSRAAAKAYCEFVAVDQDAAGF